MPYLIRVLTNKLPSSFFAPCRSSNPTNITLLFNRANQYILTRKMSGQTTATDLALQPGPPMLWSEDELMLKDMVKKFAQKSVAPLVKQMDLSSTLDKSLLDQLFQMGLMGIEIPIKYQGGAMSFTSSCIVIEELAKVDPAVSVVVDIHNTLNNTIFRKYGSEQQKKTFLPRLAQDTLSSFCLSEAESGSDAFALKTTATPSPDLSYYTLNGSKLWISNAKEAGIFIVFANVNPSKGYKGITAFILERDTTGFHIGKKEEKLGIRASSTCELTFDNVKVDHSHVLGNVGQGYKIAMESLNEGRIGIAAQMIGLAQGALDVTIPYLMQRSQFKSKLFDFQGLQFQVAQAQAELEAAKALTYSAARLNDSGAPFLAQAACAKLFSSQVAEKIASRCVEWAGGVGFTNDFPMEKFYRDVKIGQIYEGTSNMQLATIAKWIANEYKIA